MKNNYIDIAAKLGGEKTEAFLEFFPSGKSEYNRLTKTKMPVIVNRINTAATKYSKNLGATLTASLQSFSGDWKKLRDQQLNTKAELKGNRSERTVARVAVENALIAAVRHVANKFPGDVAKCMQYFDFSLLDGKHSKGGKEENDEKEAKQGK